MARRLRDRKALWGDVREFLKRGFRKLVKARVAERRFDTFDIDFRKFPDAYAHFRQFLERSLTLRGFEILPELRHPLVHLGSTWLPGTRNVSVPNRQPVRRKGKNSSKGRRTNYPRMILRNTHMNIITKLG